MKKILLFFLVLLSFSNPLKAQSDTTEINQSGYFLTFVKKVYLNPTVYLRTQDFKENTNLSFVALPDLSSDKTNASSGFEKGLQKVLRFLMQSDGGVRFYFNPDSTTHPFRFWYSDNLHCKFKQADKDSIDYYLNHNFADGNISMTNALRFETTIDKALDYIEKCLTANPQACGEEPQNETTEINTKPLSVSLHNRANSKYDIDVKQYEKLESNYAKAFDIHTQQDWYAPAKLLVTNETAEPVALAIHSNEGDFLKQNIKIEVLKTHALLPIDQASTEDSLFFSLPSTLPPGDPVEVIVKYKSPKDSVTYTVGFFMVNVMERETKNLVLIPANGFTISNDFKDSVSNELAKIYGQASVDFNVTIETGLAFPNEYPKTIEIESSGLFSNYAPDMRDYVGDVQDLENYEEDNFYLVIGLETSELQGYMPRARNIGFIFKPKTLEERTRLPKIIAHEIGHGAFHFRHIFAEEELGEEEKGQTNNIMDYVVNPKDLYLHQWNFIKDPAFVSWFGGDDEDGSAIYNTNVDAIVLSDEDSYTLSPTTVSVEGFYTPSGFAVSFGDVESTNWELKNIRIDRYSGGVSGFTLNNIVYTGIYSWGKSGNFEFNCYIKSEDLVKAKKEYIQYQIDKEYIEIDSQFIDIGYLYGYINRNKSSIPNLRLCYPNEDIIIQFFTKDCNQFTCISKYIVLQSNVENPAPTFINNKFKAPLVAIRTPFYLEKINLSNLDPMIFFGQKSIELQSEDIPNPLLCEYRKILSKNRYGARFLEKFNFNENYKQELGIGFNYNGVTDSSKAVAFINIAKAYDLLDSNILSRIGSPEMEKLLHDVLDYKLKNSGDHFSSLEKVELYFQLLLGIQAKVKNQIRNLANSKDEDYIVEIVRDLLTDEDLKLFSLTDRIKLIKCIVSDWMWRDEEIVALRILETTPEDQSTAVLDELLKSRLIYDAAGVPSYPNIFSALYSRVTGAENDLYIKVFFKLWVFSEYNNSSNPKFSYENKPLVYDYKSVKILGFYDSNYNFDAADNFSWISITKEIPSATMNGSYGSPFIGLVVDVYSEVTSTEKTYFYHPFQPIGVLSVDQDGENIQLPDARVPAFLLYTFDNVNTNQNVRFAGEIALDIVITLVGFPPFLTAIKGGFTAFKQLSRFRKLVLGVKTLEFTSGAANIILKYACDENNTTCQSVQSFLTYLEIACLSGDAIYGSIVKIKAKKLLAENMDQVRQLENADEIEELIRKSADDFANAGLDFQKYLKKAIAADVSLATKIANTSFKTGDEFVDIIIHANSAGEFIIKAEGKADKVLSKTELANVMNSVPTNKNIRLLSCNDEAAAKELSGLVTRSFYASDGWVDIYQGGQVYSKNKFYKYQNGTKTTTSLPHNATAPSGLGNKVRMGLNIPNSLNISSAAELNLQKLNVSVNVSNYSKALNSSGGAYILNGVTIEAKEISLADEIFAITGQKCIFPKNNLQAIEGFLEDGTPFTMKELESNFNSFAPRINEMSSKIKSDPNFQWIGSEGYLKIPFSSFTKNDGTVQAVTKQYVEQQFNAAIGRNAFTIKNDGTLNNITVFLNDGSSFTLDLTKLKNN